MFATYKSLAHVYVLYIREAHPTDGRQSQANVREGILIEDPKTIETREKVAREFAAQFKVSLPILVDGIDNRVEKDYAGMPDRIYIIDRDGKVAYKGAPGPRGFKVSEVPPVLDRLLGVTLASKAAIEDPRPGEGASTGTAAIPQEMRERVADMLRRFSIEEKDGQQIQRALSRRIEAYRGVQEARAELMRAAARAKGEVDKPLLAYQEAQKAYAQTVEKIDRDLEDAIGYRKKPTLEAALTALGLIGTPPGPPMSGIVGPAGRPGKPNKPER